MPDWGHFDHRLYFVKWNVNSLLNVCVGVLTALLKPFLLSYYYSESLFINCAITSVSCAGDLTERRPTWSEFCVPVSLIWVPRRSIYVACPPGVNITYAINTLILQFPFSSGALITLIFHIATQMAWNWTVKILFYIYGQSLIHSVETDIQKLEVIIILTINTNNYIWSFAL